MSLEIRYPIDFLEFYHKAAKMRALQLAIAKHYESQMMRCPVHLSIGQEHWLPLFTKYFQSNDRCFSSHRSHSMYMGVGGDEEKLIAELHGDSQGALSGAGGSMHLKDLDKGLEASIPIVGSSIGIALGSAFAAKHLNSKILTVVYFGDGACEEGILHESLNMAKIFNLPILFLCENNGYSCNTSLSKRQPLRSMSRFCAPHNIKNESIARLESYPNIDNKIKKSFNKAREEPFFLEVYSYRLYEHCGHKVDKDMGDRSIEEYTREFNIDPINSMVNLYDSVAKKMEDSIHFYSDIIERYTNRNKERFGK